jgi:hypothetical protein
MIRTGCAIVEGRAELASAVKEASEMRVSGKVAERNHGERLRGCDEGRSRRVDFKQHFGGSSDPGTTWNDYGATFLGLGRMPSTPCITPMAASGIMVFVSDHLIVQRNAVEL